MDAATPTSPLRSEIADRVARLTLDAPGRRNSLSDAMLAALGEALATIARDPEVHAVVIAAEGPAFSSGHDLKELTARRDDPDRGAAAFADVFERCSAVMQAIVALPQPVIAAVEGLATAAGCQLVASCDLAVAGAGARFCTPGVDIGLFCTTPGVALARAAAPRQVLQMLLTGEVIDADTALRIGLVNRVVEAGTAAEAAMEMARAIAAKPPEVVRLGKAAFRRQLGLPLDEAYRFGGRVMAENLLRPEAEEGVAAFLEKRPPRW